MPWWNEAFQLCLELSRITIESEHLLEKNKTWRVDGFKFRLNDKDVRAHHPEMEEALWAAVRGFS